MKAIERKIYKEILVKETEYLLTQREMEVLYAALCMTIPYKINEHLQSMKFNQLESGELSELLVTVDRKLKTPA